MSAYHAAILVVAVMTATVTYAIIRARRAARDLDRRSGR